jgi:hypothetical protein
VKLGHKDLLDRVVNKGQLAKLDHKGLPVRKG